MQSLRDAATVLALLLVLASVRVAPVEPVSSDLVPAAHAAATELDSPLHVGAAEPALPELDLVLPSLSLSESGTVCGGGVVRIESLDPEHRHVRVRLEPAGQAPPVSVLRARKMG